VRNSEGRGGREDARRGAGEGRGMGEVGESTRGEGRGRGEEGQGRGEAASKRCILPRFLRLVGARLAPRYHARLLRDCEVVVLRVERVVGAAARLLRDCEVVAVRVECEVGAAAR
jgi:hypothetical protein